MVSGITYLEIYTSKQIVALYKIGLSASACYVIVGSLVDGLDGPAAGDLPMNDGIDCVANILS